MHGASEGFRSSVLWRWLILLALEHLLYVTPLDEVLVASVVPVGPVGYTFWTEHKHGV